MGCSETARLLAVLHKCCFEGVCSSCGNIFLRLQVCMQAGSGSDSDDELPPVRQAFLRNHPQNGKPSQQLADSESDEDDLKKPSKPAAASKAGKAAGSKTKPSAKVAPAKASGASKAGAKKSSGAAAPAKRAASASGISQSQQQQQSESTAGGSVAGELENSSSMKCFQIESSLRDSHLDMSS